MPVVNRPRHIRVRRDSVALVDIVDDGLNGQGVSDGAAHGYVIERREAQVEGIEAEGTRSIITIAVGQIGNDRPIVIVSERWYSPVLQAVVLSKHNDPRVGENVYRLTNINRAEPTKSLFELPADYKVEEASFPSHRPPTGGRRKPDNF